MRHHAHRDHRAAWSKRGVRSVRGGAYNLLFAIIPQLHALLDGDLPTAVFDATGHAGSMIAFAHGGTLIFVGLFQSDTTFHDPGFHRRKRTLLSSRNPTDENFAQVMAMAW